MDRSSRTTGDGEERAGAGLLEAASDVLAAAGPMQPEDLVERLLEEGHGDGQEGVRALVLGPRGPYRLADGRVCDAASVLDSMVLTHWLSPVEAGAGRVSLHPDLVGLLLVADQGLGIIGGGGLELIDDPDSPAGMLEGPEGWLDATEGGEFMAVTVIGHLLSVMIGGEPRQQPAAETAAGLRDTLLELEELGHSQVELPELIVEARARDQEVLDEPVPPLTELLPRVGLRLDGLRVVPVTGG